ncbi:MAG: regulatory domain of in-like proprotein convertase, partial [Planctomycetaceae bacterium]|nr:regulatory domain of in-like proprotein convertase [Planctomycetaceae bacterium]
MLFRLKYWGSSYGRRKSRVKPVFTERLEDRILLFAGADSPADIVSIVSASSIETAAPEVDYADTDQSGIVGNFYLPPQYRLNGAGVLLTGPTSGTPLEIATGFLNQHALELGLSSDDLSQFIVTSQYTDEGSGTTHLYLRQTLNGIEVVNADISISITAKGEVIHAASSFVSDAHVVDGSSSQVVVNASQAFMGWSDYLGLGLDSPTRVISIDSESPDSATVFSVDGTTIADVAANLVYVPTAGGLELAWRLDVHDSNYTHWLDAFVSASTGDAIYTDNRVGNATYNVFALPARSPIDGNRSIVNDPQDATASPFGWNDTNGVAGAEFTDTRGNNATVQEDVNADDAGGFRPSGGAGLNFDFPLDTTQDPFNSQSAAIANAFYWVNLLHDIHYQYGFTEAAGNFQVNNYGRGGAGNDPVIVDVQDGASVGGGGFAALPDGQSPRMTMQRWTGPYRDGSLDSDILIHEFGHGISERLTGGPGNTSALNAVQSRAMSEGWGDWWAIMLTQVPSDAKLDAYPIGNYVAGFAANGPGIRVYPYSFDMTIDPLTYNNFNGGAANNESHKAGTIWASALWDMNWLLIDKYGFSSDMLHGTGGNNLALQLVMDGLKLQGTSPSFLAGRDAILAADVALTGGQNQTEIWKAFARRGMGYSASDGGGAGSTTVVQAFDVPASISGTVFRDDDASGTQNGAEPGLAGRTVYLDLNNNGVLDVSTTTVFNSTDTPKPLPDAPNILSTRTISGLSGVITDINVTVNISHPNVGDLYVTLISPANTPVILANYLGGTGDNYTSTTFDDEAATYIYSASAPFTGSFRPFFDLAQLDGRDPNGTWKLRIDDGAAGNTGTLLSWSMQISYGNPDRTVVTDANGNYSFYGLGNATHHIRDVVPAGFTQTSPVSGVQNVTISGGQSVNGRNFGLLAAATVSNTTALEDTLSPAIIINPANGLGITYFKISGIIGGTLFKNNGVTAINNGDFITVAEGQAGVKFLPSANSNVAGHFDVELSQNGTSVLTQTSKASATISVTPIGDTPQVASIVTLEDSLSGPIVIGRNANDGNEVTHFKVSGVTGGSLFKSDGATQINNGSFITFAEAQSGVRFLPSANSTSDGHFDVESSQNGSTVAAQSGKATSTITVTPIGDTPVVASLVTLEDTLSGPIVIGRHPNDGNEVTHFKISGINGGSLFKSDGVTQISNGSFITFAEAQAGVRFLPSANSTSDGHFDVESSQNGSTVAAQSGKATSTITVTPIGDTPMVASLVTLEDTLSGPIVIGRHPNDGNEVTHFKISGITGGSLFKSDGVTQINNGSFITFAEAQSGVRFLPSANSTSDGHFDVESSQNGSTVAAQSGKATSTITVTSVNDVPTIDLIPDPTAILQDAGLQSIGLNGISAGGGEVQTLTIMATSDNTNLVSDVLVTYSQGSTTATLSYTPIANQHGVATVTVTVSDGGQGGLVMRQFVVKVLGVNNAPTSLNLSSTVVTENQPVGTVVGTFSTQDSDPGNTFTYSLTAGTGDTNNSSFQIVGNQLRTSASFDFESVAEYSIRVESTDQDGLSVAAIFHISVQDANEPPTGIILQTIVSSLPENVSTVVAIPLAGIQVTDDALGSETLTLAGQDAAIFEIVGNELRLRLGVTLNFEARSSYSVTINADDPTVGAATDAFAVFGLTITNVNETPTDIGLSSAGLAENNAPNAAVGTFSALDPDSNDSFTYSLVPGIGSTDNVSFGISGNVLTVKPVTDFETKSSYAIRIQVTDQGGLTFEKPLTINVTNVNEAPINLVLSATNIVENNVADASVGTFSATDPDSGGTFTYGLVAGAGSTDNSSFNISGNTLTITPVANFEAKGSYAIRIRVTDQGGLTFEKPFTINVTNVNEPPTDLALSATSIAEN